MTRFARAKGSKASNERVPNEATPWHVMKGQLDDRVATMEKDEPRKSAEQLLSEKDVPYYCDTTGNVNNEWAEFETLGVKKSKKSKKISSSRLETREADETTVKKHGEVGELRVLPKSKSNKRTSKSGAAEGGRCDVKEESVNDCNAICPQTSSKKRKSNVPTESGLAKDGEKEAERKRSKKDKKVNSTTEESVENSDFTKETKEIKERENNAEGRNEKSTVAKRESEDEKITESKGTRVKQSKRHKRNQKRISKNAIERGSADAASGKKRGVAISGSFDVSGNDWNSGVNFGEHVKFEDSKNSGDRDERSADDRSTENRSFRPNNRENNGAKIKVAKIRDDKEHKRRKPETGSTVCVINGLRVEIVKYDGFPVKREDAERLEDLKKKMITRGIRKSEIDVAMKLERRKAEKALARVKKQVCFHCRKAGHNLSDCPELGREESVTGICFKCGSTEHTHFQCKVTRKDEFRFASCFICREQGHIAKQCPDNPRGLYPEGGACKICGDVTHLKKDCPDLTREKEEATVTLGTIAENNLESLEDHSIGRVTRDESKVFNKSKVVKF